MKLPNAEQAVVDIEKLRDYCLDLKHPRGRHKARVFAAALGFTSKDAELFRSILLRAIADAPSILAQQDEHGQRYVIDIQMSGPKGQALVRSSWIVSERENFPRFISCYVLS
jgi:hypothetical protein